MLLTNRAAARMMIPVDGADGEAGEARVRTLKALVDCERAVRADETYNRARVRLATCHMKLADFDAALACLEAAPEPNDADIANAVVEAARRKGHLDKVLGAPLNSHPANLDFLDCTATLARENWTKNARPW